MKEVTKVKYKNKVICEWKVYLKLKTDLQYQFDEFGDIVFKIVKIESKQTSKVKAVTYHVIDCGVL